jgi:cytochrome b6-f complex iron-sulfur subunit
MPNENILPLDSPSPSRRQLLNFLTGAVVATVASASLYPAAKFLIPPKEETQGGAIRAKDVLGVPIPASQILANPGGTRALVAGLGGEPTYLTVQEDGTLHPWGIVDECTHLGCTFPWNGVEEQFQCPCHGSRYSSEGIVLRGPANLPLKLVHVRQQGEIIWLSPWTEDDPRTEEKAWWV